MGLNRCGLSAQHEHAYLCSTACVQRSVVIIEAAVFHASDRALCRAGIRSRIHDAVRSEFENVYPGLITLLVCESAALPEAPAYGKPIITITSSCNGDSDYRTINYYNAKKSMTWALRN